MTVRDWSAFIGGRVALVTGAGAGIGRAIAIQMARAGARVWVNDVDDGRADSVCGEIRAEGGQARPALADVCDGDAVARMVERTGALDILVNNAGSGVRSWSGGQRLVPFAESGPEDWDPVIRVNLAGVLHVTRAYLPAMLDAAWGRILVIVSDAGGARRGHRGRPGPRGEARPRLPGRAPRARRGPGTPRRAAVQRRGRVDHRAGLSGRRRVRPGALSPAGSERLLCPLTFLGLVLA